MTHCSAHKKQNQSPNSIFRLPDCDEYNLILIGRIRGFLGVYSGRIGKEEIHAQLGLVWKSKVIEEIIIGQTRGNIEFQTGKKNNGL